MNNFTLKNYTNKATREDHISVEKARETGVDMAWCYVIYRESVSQ